MSPPVPTLPTNVLFAMAAVNIKGVYISQGGNGKKGKGGWFFYFFLIPNPSVESRSDFIILSLPESLFLPPVNSREGERKECRMKAEES